MANRSDSRRVPVLGSLGRTARLTWIEVLKLFGHKFFPCILLVALVLTVGLALIGKAFSQGGEASKFSNYTLWVISSTYALRVAIILLVALAAMSMSSEATSRTLNTILTRPISRIEFISAKVLSLVVATLLVTVMAALAGFVIGGTVKDAVRPGRMVVGPEGEAEWQEGSWPSYGDVVDPRYPDTVIAPRGEVMRTIALGFLLLMVPALAAVFSGFVIGTLLDSSGLAIGLAVGVSVALVLGEFFPGFVEYVGRFGFNNPVPKLATVMADAGSGTAPVWDAALEGLKVSAAYIAGSLVISYLVFCRRDVTL